MFRRNRFSAKAIHGIINNGGADFGIIDGALILRQEIPNRDIISLRTLRKPNWYHQDIVGTNIHKSVFFLLYGVTRLSHTYMKRDDSLTFL